MTALPMAARTCTPPLGLLSLQNSRCGGSEAPQIGLMAACVVALWLLTRPCYGIFHDSLLYTAQALHTLYPQKFDGDLYFRFGSQDQFTLFSSVYSPAIKYLGLAQANLFLTVFWQALWLVSLGYLIRAFTLRYLDVLMNVALVVAIPATYGEMFHYGEPLLTPRLPAEAMILLAMGLLIRNRPYSALLLAGSAAALHPIMALPGLVLILVYELQRNYLWLFAGMAIAAVIIGLAWADVPLFSRAALRFDDEWFQFVQYRSSFAFLSRWRLVDWSFVVSTSALLTLALLHSNQQERLFLIAISIMGTGGLLCAFLGGDVLRNVLAVEAQPWRGLWLATVVSHAFVLPTYHRIEGDSDDATRLLRGGLVLGVVLLVCAQFSVPIVLVAAPVLLATCFACIWLRIFGYLWYQFARYGAILVGSVAIGGALSALYVVMRLYAGWPSGLAADGLAFSATVFALGLGTANWRRVRPMSRPRLFLQALIAIGLLLAAARGWDRRSDWDRLVETEAPMPTDLAGLLPEGANVYWEDGTVILWLWFKRASYFSCLQGAGSVFFRGTAMEYKRLATTFRRLHTLDFGNGTSCPTFGTDIAAATTVGDLRYVCDREPQLDYIVLLDEVPGAPSRVWQAPFSAEVVTFGRTSDRRLTVRHPKRYFIYDCRDLRSN